MMYNIKVIWLMYKIFMAEYPIKNVINIVHFRITA